MSSSSHEVFELNIKNPGLAREIYHDLETKEGMTFIGVLGPLTYLVSSANRGVPRRTLMEGRYNISTTRRRLLPPHWEKKAEDKATSNARQRFVVQLVALRAQGVLENALPRGADPKWSFLGRLKYAVSVREEYTNATRFLLSTSPWVATFDIVREYKQHGLFARDVIRSGGEQYSSLPSSSRTGEGVTVAIGDSGVDMNHPGFARFSPAYVVYDGGEGVKAKVATLSKTKAVYLAMDVPDGQGGRTQTDNDDEHNGHGTSMAWLLAGDHKSRRSQAKLMVVDFMKGDGVSLSVPVSVEHLLEVIYGSGARIFSNSWGSDSRGDYTFLDMEFDDFVWRHQDFCILVSAGNEGPERRTVTSPGIAKNVITIGASQNSRQSFASLEANSSAYWDNPWQRGFSATGSCENIAAFSSRGPTVDGRVKPDLVAPGEFILSARAKPKPGEADMHHGRGTSPAAPNAANAATELIEVFVKQFKLSEPTSALIKATLVGYSKPLQGGSYTMMLNNKTGLIGGMLNRTPLGRDEQGYGRVHLPPVIEQLWLRDKQTLDVFGQCIMNFTIVTDGEVTVSIAWVDPPAIPFGNHRTMVNNFDLRVILAREKTYMEDDYLNNVERQRFFAKRGEEMIVMVTPRGPLTPYAGIEPTFAIAIHGAVQLQPTQPRCHPRAPPLQCFIGGEIGGRGCLPDGTWGPCRARCHQKGLYWINESTCGCIAPLPCPPAYESWVRMRECLTGGTLALENCPTAIPPKPIPPRRRLREEVPQVASIWVGVSAAVFVLFYAFHIRKRHKRWLVGFT